MYCKNGKLRKSISKIAIATTGGDAPGMNACIRAIYKTASKKWTVYGIKDGFVGLMKNQNHVFQMQDDDVRLILERAGTILGSSRLNDIKKFCNGSPKSPEKLIETLDQSFVKSTTEFLNTDQLNNSLFAIKKTINAWDLDAIIFIGGDYTCIGATLIKEVCKDLRVIVIPASIDNNISGTETTIGYDTAVNTAIDAIDCLRATALSHDRIFIIEIMGGGVGRLALDVAIGCGAETVLIPEMSQEEIQTRLHEFDTAITKRRASGKKSAIIIVAEGVDVKGNSNRNKSLSVKSNYSGAVSVTEYLLANGFEEDEIRTTILGHVQRGGKPTALTRELGTRMGYIAVQCLLSSKEPTSKNPLLVAVDKGAITAKEIVTTAERKVESEELQAKIALLGMVL